MNKSKKLLTKISEKKDTLCQGIIENSEKQNLVIIDTENNIFMSYRELYNISMRIAASLVKSGVKKGDYVGVFLPRGYKQIVTIIGIMLAGGVYVPIGINQPMQRRKNIYKQMNFNCIISETVTIAEFKLLQDKQNIKDFRDLIAIEPLKEPIDISRKDEAYVIMTSGTTGVPKAVKITHGSVMNTINDVNSRYGVNENDKVLSVSSIDFDLSVYDIFGLIAVGGTIVCVCEKEYKDPVAWINLINEYGITVWNSVPLLFDMLVTVEEICPSKNSLRLVLLSGDWISIELAKRYYKIYPNTILVGLGGATEASIWSNFINIPRDIPNSWKTIPYGKPLSNQILKIVDENDVEMRKNEIGEILIGGHGVSSGYIGDSELNEKKFFKAEGLMWYRTGDLGRLSEDGLIELIGRKDNMIKFKGHRIDTTEIQYILNQIEGIKFSTVELLNTRNGSVQLIAFISSEREIISDDSKYILVDEKKEKYKTNKKILMSDVIKKLVVTLPEYMIPLYFYVIEDIPLNNNGKLDRSFLKSIMETFENKKNLKTDNAILQISNENKDEDRELIAKVWRDVLGARNEVDFFLQGGDSLKATVLILKLSEAFNTEIPINIIFEYPKFDDLVIEVKKKVNRSSQFESQKMELSEIQQAYYLGRNNNFELGGRGTTVTYAIETKRKISEIEQGLNYVINNQEMLRTIILNDNEQEVLNEVPYYNIRQIPLSDMQGSEREILKKVINEKLNTNFNPNIWPLFDFSYFTIYQKKYLIVTFDMLIADAASLVVCSEGIRDFNKKIKNSNKKIGSYNYFDYIAQKKEEKNTPKYQRDRDFWMEKIPTIALGPQLPLLNVRTSVENKIGTKRVEKRISLDTWNRINEISKKTSISPSIIVMTAYSYALAMKSRGKEFTINMTYNDRSGQKYKDVIGDFTNSLFIGFNSDRMYNKTFLENAKQVALEFMTVRRYQYFSSIEVLRGVVRDKKITTLSAFPVVFTSLLYEKFSLDSVSYLGKIISGITQTPQVYLDCIAMIDNDELVITMDYVDKYLKQETVIDIINIMQKILKTLSFKGNLDFSNVEQYIIKQHIFTNKHFFVDLKRINSKNIEVLHLQKTSNNLKKQKMLEKYERLNNDIKKIQKSDLKSKKIYILDDQLYLCPPEKVGNIYIDITDYKGTDKELLSSSIDSKYGKLYRTNYLAKHFTEVETIQIIGSKFREVLVNGFYFNLESVEKVIDNYIQYTKSYVEMKGSSLKAYIVNRHENIVTSQLIDYLSKNLSPYMIPEDIVVLKDSNEILTFESEYSQHNENILSKEEEDLYYIWKKTLQLSHFDINESFFNLGGDSLKAMQIYNDMLEQGYSIELKDLYENNTIKKLANLIRVSNCYEKDLQTKNYEISEL